MKSEWESKKGEGKGEYLYVTERVTELLNEARACAFLCPRRYGTPPFSFSKEYTETETESKRECGLCQSPVVPPCFLLRHFLGLLARHPHSNRNLTHFLSSPLCFCPSRFSLPFLFFKG